MRPAIRTPARRARFGPPGGRRVGQTVLIRDGYVCIECSGEVEREAVVAALESFGELDIGNYTIAYGPNRQRQGASPSRIELQVVGKGGGFVY